MKEFDQFEQSVFEYLGLEKITAMVSHFYGYVAVDDLMRPMYPGEDLAGAEERLLDFIVFRLGGPDDYIQKRGHPRLRMRHAPFAIGMAARDRWLELMGKAMDDEGIAGNVRVAIESLYVQIANFMINR